MTRLHTFVFLFSTGFAFFSFIFELKLLTRINATHISTTIQSMTITIEMKRRGTLKNVTLGQTFSLNFFCFACLIWMTVTFIMQKKWKKKGKATTLNKEIHDAESGSAGLFGLTNLYSLVATWTLQPNNVKWANRWVCQPVSSHDLIHI